MTAIAPQTPDFYLWGFLKDHVYENCPQSIAKLKVAITQKIYAIRKEECVRVTSLLVRLCLSASSVSEAQQPSFGTCALINVSFELTSILQFLSYRPKIFI